MIVVQYRHAVKTATGREGHPVLGRGRNPAPGPCPPCPPPAHADTITWNGGSGEWTNTANWVGGVLPGSNDIARFEFTVAATWNITVGSPQTIDELQTIHVGTGTAITFTGSKLRLKNITAGGSGRPTCTIWNDIELTGDAVFDKMAEEKNHLHFYGSISGNYGITIKNRETGFYPSITGKTVGLFTGNSYTGNTTMKGNVGIYTNSASFGAGTTVTVNGGARLYYGGKGNDNNVALPQYFNILGANVMGFYRQDNVDLTLAGFHGSGTIRHYGRGITLTADSTHTGWIEVRPQGGWLRVNGTTASANVWLGVCRT